MLNSSGVRECAKVVCPLSRVALLAGVLGVWGTGQALPAEAVVLDGSAQATGKAAFSSPYGIAADPLGNYYVVDGAKHQIVKFDVDGQWTKVFGSIGQGAGQLYYPQGVVVGTHNSNFNIVYVADTSNSRVVAFADNGRYLDSFGGYGSGDAQFDNPSGIAFAKYPSAPGGRVLVADTRNFRVGVFDDDGNFTKNLYCNTCPNHQIRPLGVAARFTPGTNSVLRIYVVDELTSQVEVMNENGRWLQSIGKKGTHQGEFSAPDDVAVDEDGNVWVADAGIGLERVTKFSPNGKFLYSFDRAGGATTFVQPHGVAVDQQGKIYVANTGGPSAFRFKEDTPRISAGPYGSNEHWIDTKGIWFSFWYNGVERTCRGNGTATVTAPLSGGNKTFTVDSGPVTIAGFDEKTKMDLTTTQVNWLKLAWNAGKEVKITAHFQARCAGELLKKSISFSR